MGKHLRSDNALSTGHYEECLLHRHKPRLVHEWGFIYFLSGVKCTSCICSESCRRAGSKVFLPAGRIPAFFYTNAIKPKYFLKHVGLTFDLATVVNGKFGKLCRTVTVFEKWYAKSKECKNSVVSSFFPISLNIWCLQHNTQLVLWVVPQSAHIYFLLKRQKRNNREH